MDPTVNPTQPPMPQPPDQTNMMQGMGQIPVAQQALLQQLLANAEQQKAAGIGPSPSQGTMAAQGGTPMPNPGQQQPMPPMHGMGQVPANNMGQSDPVANALMSPIPGM